MKRIFIVSLALLLTFTGAAYAASLNGDYKGNPIVKIFLGDKELTPPDVPAQVIDGRTMVPLGLLRDAGFTVEWDQQTYSVKLGEEEEEETSANLERAFKLSKDGVTLKKVGTRSVAEATFEMRVSVLKDSDSIIDLMENMSAFGADYIRIRYLDSDGKLSLTIGIDTEILLRYMVGEISQTELRSNYDYEFADLSPSKNKNPLTTQEIAALSNAVGFVYMYDTSNRIVGTGSGFMLDSGIFITNSHVANGGGGGIVVKIDGLMYDARYWFLFDNSFTDVYGVLLSTQYDMNGSPIGERPKHGLAYTTVLPGVGDKVYSIGSPNGLENTLSEGIVSAIRTIDGVQYIQHTADTEAGSSGGVLLNEYGIAIGITTSGIPGTTQDFAVPMHYVQAELDKK